MRNLRFEVCCLEQLMEISLNVLGLKRESFSFKGPS